MSGICPVEIDDVSEIVDGTISEIVDGTISEILEAERAHPVWSDGCGRFSQSDRFFCVSRRECRRYC